MNRHEKVWDALERVDAGDLARARLHRFLLWLIALNAVAVIAGSVAAVEARWGIWLDWFECFSVMVFTAEYLARVWSCTASDRFPHPVWGRLRYMVTPMALVDLVAILPFYIAPFAFDLRSIRVLRLVRLLRLFKLGRYWDTWLLIARVITNKKEELLVSFGLTMAMVMVASTLMYSVEHEVQPDLFPHIPSAMWWAVITLTTIGYGDVSPITPMGKLLGAAIAVISVLMIALPTAVFASGFLDEVGAKRKQATCCPHCGKPV